MATSMKFEKDTCDSGCISGDQRVPSVGLNVSSSNMDAAVPLGTYPTKLVPSPASRDIYQEKDLVESANDFTLDSGLGLGSGVEQEYSSRNLDQTSFKMSELTARDCISQTSENVEQMFQNLSLNTNPCTAQKSDDTSGVSLGYYSRPIPGEETPLDINYWDSLSFWPSYFHQDEEGDTDLHISIIHRRPEALQIIETAITNKCLDVQNHQYLQTPLHLAVLTEQPYVVRKLVCWGATVDIRDQRGDTPLHIACRIGSLGCVKALTVPLTYAEVKDVSYEALSQAIPQNQELINYEGKSCLHTAAVGQHAEIVQHLVEHCGADINKQETKAGRTVLHEAVLINNVPWVKALLNIRGREIEAVTFAGKTALDIALGCGYQETAALLQVHGAEVDDMECDELDSDEESSSVLTYDDISINGRPVSLESS